MEQGTVHVQQRITVLRPVLVGALLDVEVEVVEKDEKARRRVVLEQRFNDAGKLACRATATYLWGYAAR